MLKRSLLAVVMVVSASLVAIAPRVDAATTLFVDDEVDCDDTDGVPYYCTIQAAVDAAADGDTIQVAAGTYTGSGVTVVDNFGVDLTINGAGEGLTIIDGENTRGGIRFSGHSATITGLTVQNASASGSGGGITIQNPAMTTPFPVMLLEDVTVQDGTATASAAGILAFSRTVIDLVRVTVSGNDALDPGGLGAGMHIGGLVTATITDSEFTMNSADADGGGIWVSGGDSSLEIHRSTFANNSAGEDGGAVAVGASGLELTITDTTFDTNNAGEFGGAIFVGNSGTVEISGSYFARNTASAGSGGAIGDLTQDGVFIANSTFYDNDAALQGGAVYTSGVITNSSFGANSSAVAGGAVATNGFSGPKLRNTILYGNPPHDCYVAVSQGYNLIGDPTDCALSGDTTGNLLAADPGWALPADNGGATFTMKIFDGSAAQDAGNPATPGSGGTTCEPTDQRGFLRSDGACDIGAFEVDAGPVVIRYAGSNRFGTAAAVSENDFPDLDAVTEVFVATGFNFPDALAGAAVAGKLGAPLLLVDTGIPAATAAELTRLDPDVITILGGTGAVSAVVETDLGGYAPTVDRLSGTNRYLTAVAISQHGFPADGSADVVYVATGIGFADALAAASAATVGNGPVLLVDGTSVSAAVANEIVRLTPDRIVVVGGTSVVSDAVLTALDALQIGDTVERIAGTNRYRTAVAISEDAFPGGSNRVYIATGLNFPDALAGAAAAGKYDAPVLLVPGTSLPAEVSTEITRLGAVTVVILGGTGVVTTAVEDELKTLIGAN